MSRSMRVFLSSDDKRERQMKGFHAYFLVIFDIDINASSLGRDFGRWRIKTSLIVIVALHQFVGTVEVREFFIVLRSKRTKRDEWFREKATERTSSIEHHELRHRLDCWLFSFPSFADV